MKKIAIIMLCSMLVGCGNFERWKVSMTGNAQETCHDGVVYLQFTSGATVKYQKSGQIALCK